MSKLHTMPLFEAKNATRCDVLHVGNDIKFDSYTTTVFMLVLRSNDTYITQSVFNNEKKTTTITRNNNKKGKNMCLETNDVATTTVSCKKRTSDSKDHENQKSRRW